MLAQAEEGSKFKIPVEGKNLTWSIHEQAFLLIDHPEQTFKVIVMKQSVGYLNGLSLALL